MLVPNAPFGEQLHKKTLTKYRVDLQRLVAMLLRDQGPLKTPLPKKLELAIVRLRKALKDGGELQEPLHHLFQALWLREWHKSSTNLVPDPTERFVLLFSLREDGSFSTPKNMTMILSALKHAVRTFVLHETHARAAILKRGAATDAREDEDTEDSLSTCDTKAYKEVEVWLHGQGPSSFKRLCDLASLASRHAKERSSTVDFTTPHLMAAETFTFNGNPIKLSDIRDTIALLEADMVQILEEDVLLGTKLHVTWGELADDVPDPSNDYSFVSDPRNPLFSQHGDDLKRAILSDDRLKERFTCALNRGKAAPDRKSIPWSSKALTYWFKSFTRLLLLHALRCCLLSGGPGWGEDLTGMTYRGPLRGLRVHQHRLVFLRPARQTKTVAGVVPMLMYGVDQVQADLLIQGLALALPFAMFIIRTLHQDRPEFLHRAKHELFFNHNYNLFSVDQLSNELAKYFERGLHIQWRLTMRDWRHIYRAYLDDLSRSSQGEGLDRHLQEIAARQSGHSLHTETLHYGLTPQSKDHAISHEQAELCLGLSARFQWEMMVVPGRCCGVSAQA